MTKKIVAGPPGHPSLAGPRVGVLFVNLGTPDAPEAGAVKSYLRQFLSDRRVVEIPQIVWQPILRGIILNTRPKKSAHAYQQVWMDEGSPLAVYTRRIAEGMAGVLGGSSGHAVQVDWAMRYGNPSVGSRLDALKVAGCTRILIAPLYPQYCAATTGSVMDAVAGWLGETRWQPAIRTLPPYHDDPAYIAALAASVERQLAELDFAPERILASFHGMPARTLALGDPYHCHCQKTARLLGEALGRPVDISFQSRFGRAKWLEPETESVLRGLASQGVLDVAVIAPGFAADCLETLEEIGLRGKEAFLAAQGRNFALLRCLNADTDAIHLYRTLIGRELGGWVDTVKG